MKDEFGFVELDVKAVTAEGDFEGYASVFNVEDLGKDVVMPGAFAKSLARRPAAKVKMLRGHDPSEPIGIWTDLSEDKRGLRAKGRLILETTKGRETHALMKAGALDGLSIGYRTLKDRFDRAKGVRLLDELDLPEISVVAFPMNTRATVSTVKTAEHARALVSELKRWTEVFSK
jgi:HK97 family phage prohead protease